MKKLLIPSLTIVALSACGVTDKINEDRGRGDAGVSSVEDSPKQVIQFPDRFGNVATACVEGNRVFVTTRTENVGVQLEVVAADPSC